MTPKDDTCPPVADPAFFTRVSSLITAGDSPDDVLQAIVEEAVRVTGAVRGFLAVVDHERGELNVRYTAGEGWTEEKRVERLKVSEETGKGITSRVAATRKPYRSGNVLQDPYYIMSFDDVRSELAVPLVDSYHRTRGVINVESTEFNSFGEGHEKALSALANLGTIGLTIFEYRAREQALVEIGRELSALSDENEILQKVIDVAADVLKFEDCSLFLSDPATGKLVLRASRGPLASQVGIACYEIGDGLTGWTAQHREVVRLSRPHKDPRWRGRYEELPAREVGAFMAVPVRGHGDQIGVLRVQRKKSPYKWFPNDFTDDDERILTTISAQLGNALENAGLVRQLVKTERMAAWGELSARSAHMIGNRVFAIKGDVNEIKYVLSRPKPNCEAALALANSIEKGIFLLEEILTEFREFVKATHIEPEECDINELVKEAIDESYPKRCNTKLTLQLSEGLPLVSVDRRKLKRCFSELIENAIGFLEGSGSILIRTSTASDDAKARLKPRRRDADYIEITFEDTGPGIPSENKPKIFNPFFSSRAKGMGLGLSIVKGIVEAHQGVIFEDGEPGKGAKFTILLPVHKEARSSGKHRCEDSAG